MPHLTLVRHGESQFNAKSLWTGIWDVPLTQKGLHDAALMAKAIKDTKPDVAYCSALTRAKQTLDVILRENKWTRIPKHFDKALNERDYGDLTGMNKWAVQEQYGKEQFNNWRRGWNEPVPGGETLKMVFQRVVPYYETHILPDLKRGKNVIIAAHGNSLRALIKYLDELTDQQVQNLDMPFHEALIYALDDNGKVTGKDVRKIEIGDTPA